jgi:Tol biopolymer transport system component
VLAVVALALPSGTASAPYEGTQARSLAGRIVFARDVGPHSELYVATTQGRILRRLTRNGSSDYGPRWSPDGSQIVFGRIVEPGVFNIFSLDPATGDEQLLLADSPPTTYSVAYPTWQSLPKP